MHTQEILPFALIRCLAVSGMALLLAAGTGVAQTGPANYALLVGAGFLCEMGNSSACPAVVKTPDGSSYELTGVGVLDAQEKSVTATGTFVHKSSDGTTLETGIWIAKELLSFQFYGLAPGALMREGMAMGQSPLGPRQMPMPGGRMGGMHMMGSPMPAGGLAVLHIRLLPVAGFARFATLQVNCALGKVPDEHPTEGVRLSFERGISFDQEVSGRTMFLVTRPEPKPAEKSSAQKPPAPDSAGVESEPNTTPPENPR
jgi:hypothetical protein